MSEYEDIIDLARPASVRPKMPREERAAQFAPFAALVGFARRVREMGAEHLEEVAQETVVEYEEGYDYSVS